MRVIYAAVALIIYAVFFSTFLYLIGFVAALPMMPLSVDRGLEAPIGTALVVDAALIALFGLQHSVMARQGFKRAWTRIVPPALERSVYVLASSLVLMALFSFWRPIPIVLWQVEGGAALVLWGLAALGWAMVLFSTFLINHFDLFGLAQVYRHWQGKTANAPRFTTPLLYTMVRHPLYLGFVIAFWATPVMTLGHVLLAGGMTIYILIAIGYEERDLVALFGDEYRRYRQRVGMLVPGIGKARA